MLLTLSVEQKQKIELARDLLSHANPTGDFAVVVERALDALIASLEKRRFGQGRGQRPSPTSPTPARNAANASRERLADENCAGESGGDPGGAEGAAGSEALRVPPRRRHIRNAIRRELLARDGACCSFVGREGERCNARAFLQIHHRHPWALGGNDTSDNLALLCHAHNRLLAERDFGEAHVAQVIAQRKTSPHKDRK